MNKQVKEESQKLNEKLCACNDELSLLLDLIYKYPQQQRERYYDRIQLLKQNLNQLKICVKESQSLPNAMSIQKKYQQIFLKIVQLKNDINSFEISIVGKKKKANANDELSGLEIGQFGANKCSGVTLKGQYESIMETIVQKDEQVKKCKYEIAQMKQIVKDYDDKEDAIRRSVQEMERELTQIRAVYERSHTKNIVLEKQLQERTIAHKTLQHLFAQQKQTIFKSQLEIKKLTNLFQQAANHLKTKKDESEINMIKLATLEQKYKYDIKQYIDMTDTLKMKEIGNDKKIKDLQRGLSQLQNVQCENKELIVECLKLREEIKKLSSEIAIQEEQLFEKNRKIQLQNSEISVIRLTNGEFKVDIEKKDAYIKDLLVLEEQKRIKIVSLERNAKELERGVLESKESMFVGEERLKQAENALKQFKIKNDGKDKEIYELQTNFFSKDDRIRKLQIQLSDSQLNSSLALQERQKLQREIERVQAEMVKSYKKIEETNKILIKTEEEKTGLSEKVQQLLNVIVQRDDQSKTFLKEIENLKKRLLRSKIECIHNIRQIIV